MHLCFILFLVCLNVCVCECLLQNNMRMSTWNQYSWVRGPLRECLRARRLRPTLLLHTTCVRSWCTWRTSCVAAFKKQKMIIIINGNELNELIWFDRSWEGPHLWGQTNFGPAQTRSRQGLPMVVSGVGCWVRSPTQAALHLLHLIEIQQSHSIRVCRTIISAATWMDVLRGRMWLWAKYVSM